MFIALDNKMKATILSHEKANAESAEIHRFGFELDDGNAPPLREYISLRTARVIVANLEDGNAFIKMLQAIVAASPDEFGLLVGKVFPDHFNEFPNGNRPMPGPSSEGPRP
jgi:hypothetical protein